LAWTSNLAIPEKAQKKPGFDLQPFYPEDNSALPNSEKTIEPAEVRVKPRKKYRRRAILGLMILGLVWLNGPGLRWMVPRVASHYLVKSGIRGNFKVEGSFTGGLSIADLRLEGDTALAKLTVDRIIPDYRLGGLIKGRLEGLTIDGVHADLRLGLKPKDQPEPPSPPLDLGQLVKTIRSVRERVVPMALNLKNISFAATRDGKPAFALEPSSLSHAAGSDDLTLDLGAFTDASLHEWPARKTTIAWKPGNLSIPRLDPWSAVSLRELVLQLPTSGEPSLATEVHLGEAVFVVSSSPGFRSLKVDLREGKLSMDQTAKNFDIKIPASATLTSLAVELDQVLPDPMAATGKVRVTLENITSQGWTIPILTTEASVTADQSTINLRGEVLGSEFSLDAATSITRGKKSIRLGETKGKFNIADVPKVLRELATRIPAIDPDSPIPPSAVDGNFSVSFVENKPQSAQADLVLKPADEKLATPVLLKAGWVIDQPVAADLALDGLAASATYQPEPGSYQATLTLDQFSSARINRWLKVVKVNPGGVADLSGKWSGSGEVKAGTHRGELSILQAVWSHDKLVPVTAKAAVKYDWPTGFEAKDVKVQMEDQTVALEVALANNTLELKNFLWNDSKQEFAGGSASLPVPADFSKWRDTLSKDTRPLAVAINSRVLSLGLLKPWVPALEKLDPRSTGQLTFNISGTYASPVIDAKLEARDLRSPTQPKLPPADLKIAITGRDDRLVVDASAIAPDFPAAVMKAAMAFRPSEWAAKPELLNDEAIEARVDLPRLDLSRFSSLVPMADKFSGILTGNIVVAGKIAKPEIKGTLDLTGAALHFKNDRYPAIEGTAASVELSLDRMVLKNLKSTVAGGTLEGGGSLGIKAGKLGDMDFRFRGNHLPLVRNDFMILRTNADLRLQGPWEKVMLSGTVGAVDGIFYRDIELLPIGTPFTGPSAAALPKIDASKNPEKSIPEPFRNWGLNMLVRTEEPFLIRGNLATGEVTANIRIGGTLGAPAPNGTANIKDLRASLPFSTLSVRTGILTFTPATGFDPILEIRGTAEPRPYRVTVYVYGRASNPQLVLTSNPPMPENEIMTLLATGTTTSGLEDPQAASSRALQLLVEEMRRGRFRYGKQLRPLLALLDRVDFSLAEADPYSSHSLSTATFALSERWFLSAGMGATGDSRVLAIWRIRFK
jgi:hypothetical protein